MAIEDEQTAWMITNMYAASIATQVVIACNKARVKVTGRRIEAAMRVLVREAPNDAQFDGLLSIVEEHIARIEAASTSLR